MSANPGPLNQRPKSMTLKRIEVQPRERYGGFTFDVVMAVDGREVMIENVSVETLDNYSKFRRMLLHRTGRMYQHPRCERKRTIKGAEDVWREFITELLA